MPKNAPGDQPGEGKSSADSSSLQFQAREELSTVWRFGHGGHMTLEDGLELGRMCIKWRDTFKAQGRKGEGLLPILEEVNLPVSTAYWWMDRYLERHKTKSDKDKAEKEKTLLVLTDALARLTWRQAGFTIVNAQNHKFHEPLTPAELKVLEIYEEIQEICQKKLQDPNSI